MSEVEVRGLTKEFGQIAAVRDMSFHAPAGKVTAFLGPNGSGKTTLDCGTIGGEGQAPGRPTDDQHRHPHKPLPPAVRLPRG